VDEGSGSVPGREAVRRTRGGVALVSFSSEIGAGRLGCCMEPCKVPMRLHEDQQASRLGESVLLPGVDFAAWMDAIVAQIS
jgi:hypothetical protein